MEQMNGKRTLVVASIVYLHDTCFLYPACETCSSRLILNNRRAQCPKCGCKSEVQNVNYQYRLSLKVTEKSDLFDITVFGSCLDPYFGTAAESLQSYSEDLKKELQELERSRIQSLLVQAVEDCFVGRSFIFGVKASKSHVGLVSFSQSLLQTTTCKFKYKKQFIAHQIAVPNTAVFGCTVISYYKKLLQSSNLKDLLPSSQLSDTPSSTGNQPSVEISSSTNSSSSNSQFYTQSCSDGQFSGYWQQPFALTSSSVDCIRVEDFSAAEIICSAKRNSMSAENTVEVAQTSECDKHCLSAFISPPQNNCVSVSTTDVMRSHSLNLEVQRFSDEERANQIYNVGFDKLQDSFNASFTNTQRRSDMSGDYLSDGRDSNAFQTAIKSCSKLLEKSLDCDNTVSWDDLPFSESLSEFIAKVEEKQQECKETAVELTNEIIADGSVHFNSLKRLETDTAQSITQRQDISSAETNTDFDKCLLLGSRKSEDKKKISDGNSKTTEAAVDRLPHVYSCKRADIVGKEVPLIVISSLLLEDDSASYDVLKAGPETMVWQVGSACISNLSAGSSNAQPVQTRRSKSTNLQQACSVLNQLPEVHTSTDNESSNVATGCYLKNVVFQTPPTSAKQLPERKKIFHLGFQDEKRIKQQEFGKWERDSTAGSDQPSSFFNIEKPLLQSFCTSPTKQEYNVSADLFNNSSSCLVHNKDQLLVCLQTNQCILAKSEVEFQTFNKSECKPQNQCKISPSCSERLTNFVRNQDNNSSPENDSQNVLEQDFSDSQDFVPFSQSTPVSRFQRLNSLRGKENKDLRITSHIQLSSTPVSFGQKTIGLFKNNVLRQQSPQTLKMLQQQSSSNQITFLSSNSHFLSDSPRSKSYESDCDEWIPPSTTKPQVMSPHLSSCVLNIHKSRGIKLFTSSHSPTATMETADSKAITENNKENGISKQYKVNLNTKRRLTGKDIKPTPAITVTPPKFFQTKTDEFGTLKKSLKLNDWAPTGFAVAPSLCIKDNPASCCSPELFTASAELFEEEYL
ncbi:DNA damage-induced apoptosis suppressor protein isoform X2 [Callorhinchus milii]|uniref:DNA damage-induced apoptosis suppressor protein isoform X2 n=1 Tax=Callorhinchus milii TaxID=7868 RepID=UPI001C3F6F7B|nr:DNA damage-induced apoptosis suppressor protein isoform X2 [Callorhinchus milii]